MALFAALLTGCGKTEDTANAPTKTPDTKAPAAPNTPAAVKITGAGATFPKDIYAKWIEKYQQTAQVDYQPVGSGTGIKDLTAKTVDFGASDAPLSADEAKALPNAVQIPTVGGAVVLAYNLPNLKGDLQLTPEAIAGIYLGKITKWNAPEIAAANPGQNLPDVKITPVHRSDGSGTTYIFTNYLKKVNPEWAGTVGAGKQVNWKAGQAGDKSDGVSTQVTRTLGAIGYVELNYALSKKVPYASVKNHAGAFIKPDLESTQAAIADFTAALTKDITTPTLDAPGPKSYPICSLTYVLLVKSGGTPGTADAAKFWTWAMQPEQQSMAKELYFAPLPDALVKINLDTLKSLGEAKVSSTK